MKDSAFEGWVEPEHAPTKYPVSVWEECLRVFKNLLENREDLFMEAGTNEKKCISPTSTTH